MRKLLLASLTLLLLPVFFHYAYLFDQAAFSLQAPVTEPVQLEKMPSTAKVMLVPLDSRPPCLAFVQKLGSIAACEVISPPQDILDNYTTPAQVLKVNDWVLTNIQTVDAAIIATDMLLHGGLIASRSPHYDEQLQTQVFSTLAASAQQKPVYAFSIIPRLLIPEDEQTKLWQYHVMVYATKKDMEATFQNPADFARMQEMLDRVPPELIQTFDILYAQNDQFNQQLCTLAQTTPLSKFVFGQDDGQPFGRPNQSRYKLEKSISKNQLGETVNISHGADEIALSQLALLINKKTGQKPQIFVQYGGEQVPELVMPFMSTTLGATVREKIASVGATIVQDKAAADLILFVHAGTKNISGAQRDEIAKQVHELALQKPLALVDLSYNFRQRETLVASFLNNDLPLSCLAAYAGWNTAGNSIGTALAQATIFYSQTKLLASEQLPRLYQKNLEFTVARLLDDWAYQKDVQDFTNNSLRWKNINPYGLGATKTATQEKIVDSLNRRQKSLFYKNIGRHPFYQDAQQAYYITQLTSEIKLPWERTFEIDVHVQTEVGAKKLD